MTGTKISLPNYVQIEPVGQCNLRCTMCPIQYRQDGPPYGPLAFMDFDLYTRLISENPNLEKLHLQGLGEPMMHPRFFDMVTYAKQKDIYVTTNSNFTLLNKKRAELTVRSGLDDLHISIDGANAQTYERIRVRGHFQKVIQNLELLLEARQRLRSETPHLSMVMVIMRQNLEELPDLVRLAHTWSMESIFVQHLSHDFSESSLPAAYKPMREYVEEQTLLNVDESQIERIFSQARELADHLGIDLRLPRTRMHVHPAGTPGPERCDWPWKGAYFSYDGQAMPCCMVATPDRVNFGKVNGKTFEEIWNGELYQSFRQKLSSDTPPEICAACSIYRGTF